MSSASSTPSRIGTRTSSGVCAAEGPARASRRRKCRASVRTSAATLALAITGGAGAAAPCNPAGYGLAEEPRVGGQRGLAAEVRVEDVRARLDLVGRDEVDHPRH